MTLAVADTSPICYLVLIEQINLLPQLYSRVAIPEFVRDEMAHPLAPPVLQFWINQCPTWLDVAENSQVPPGPSLQRLDQGEAEAILLAERSAADLLLIDERLGRQVARQREIPIVGTLGILDQASKLNLVDLRAALLRLQSTSFRISPKLLKELLDEERR